MLRESPTLHPADELTPAQKCDLVDRVAASVHFRKAARLRAFLLYVGNAPVHDGVSELREQDIGTRVFGRPADYDRGADNIVRVNATELRKRVDQYFAEAGAAEPFIFTIPRGAYRLVFSPRSQPATSPPPPAVPPLEPSPQPPAPIAHSSRPWIWLSAALGLACLALLVLLVTRPRQSTGDDDRPTVMQFWRGFTRDDQPGLQTDIVLSDESLSLMQDILHQSVTLPAYVDRSYIAALGTAPVSADRRADVEEILRHNLLTLGSVLAARQILTLPGLTPRFHLTVPRLYPPDLMKRNNLIILGGKKSNPWAAFFEDQLSFTLEYDTKTAQNYVSNRHPAPGEPAVYQAAASSSLPSGIAVLSYIQNPAHTRDVLLLMGSDSDATAAAAEFLTSETSMRDLARRFGPSPGSSPMPHFELVLRTSRLNGTAFTSSIVTLRRHETTSPH